MNYERKSTTRTVTYTLAKGFVVNLIREAIGGEEDLSACGESFSYDVPILPGTVVFTVTYKED